jgi:hypothetical protein
VLGGSWLVLPRATVLVLARHRAGDFIWRREVKI